MESYQKIFAEELNCGACDVRHARVKTLSGRSITKCLFCGALTEISATKKPIQNINIYDPTGMITVQYHSSNAEISAFCREATLPVFVLCAAGIRCSAGTCTPMLESIVPVSREIRDTFVLAAADELTRHLDASPDIPAEQKTQCCTMVEKALSTVHAAPPEPAVLHAAEEQILACCDKKQTVSVEELVETLGYSGISRETTLAVLTDLINAGECYQPKPNSIKRL